MESRENRLKRLRLRSWRRGMKEMDLILGRFADSKLDHLSEIELDHYECLINENDQDLYQWITRQSEPPVKLASILNLLLLYFEIQEKFK